MSICKFIKSDNSRCKASAVKTDEYCFWHSEKMKGKREKALKEGGLSPKRNYGRGEVVKLGTTEDVLKLMEQTINDLRTNRTSTRIANSIGYLSGIALKVITPSVGDTSAEEVKTKPKQEGFDFKNDEEMVETIQGALNVLSKDHRYVIKEVGKKPKRKSIGEDVTRGFNTG